MRNSLFVLLSLAIFIVGCEEPPYAEDYEAGPHGEPPKALSVVYSKQFIAAEENYVFSLGRVHRFLAKNSFYPIVYTQCFNDVLDIRAIASTEKYKKTFPCVALHASYGGPTKIFVSINVDAVKFNQLDNDNRLYYTVGIYGSDELVASFKEEVERDLESYYSVLPHNHSLQARRP